MPFRRTFVRWELQDFKGVPVGIFEVEGLNPCGGFIVSGASAVRSRRAALCSFEATGKPGPCRW